MKYTSPGKTKSIWFLLHGVSKAVDSRRQQFQWWPPGAGGSREQELRLNRDGEFRLCKMGEFRDALHKRNNFTLVNCTLKEGSDGKTYVYLTIVKNKNENELLKQKKAGGGKSDTLQHDEPWGHINKPDPKGLILYGSTHKRNPEQTHSKRQRVKLAARGQGGDKEIIGSCGFMGAGFLFGKTKGFWKWAGRDSLPTK